MNDFKTVYYHGTRDLIGTRKYEDEHGTVNRGKRDEARNYERKANYSSSQPDDNIWHEINDARGFSDLICPTTRRAHPFTSRLD